MKKQILLGLGAAILTIIGLLCATCVWIFHVHHVVFPQETISDAQWKQYLAAPQKAETTLNVLTWNIQLLPVMLSPFSEDLQKLQGVRASWIGDTLVSKNYDIICFQEAFDQESIEKLESRLKDEYPFMVYPRYASRWRALSNGVWFVSRVPIRYVDHVTYPQLHGVNWWTSKGCCLIEGVKDGLRFQIAGTHFPTGKQSDKDAAVEAIRARLLPLRQDGVPFMALGDFNTDKGSPEYDALLKILELQDAPIDDPRPYSSDPNNSWKAGKKKRPSLIDYVLLNPNGTGAEFGRQSILRVSWEYAGKPMDLSDHYGVEAQIILRP